jgi:Flp pilus assembly protein TadG
VNKLKAALADFRDCERGTASLEFVLVFPIFFAFFLMTFESGMISLRHVMLERGIDIAVRDVRIGKMVDPTRDALRTRICEVARIIPNCDTQLQLQMIVRQPRSFADIPARVPCINRGLSTQPVVEFTNGGNNELMILRACVRIDPYLPTTGLGKAFVDGADSASGGSYALVSVAAFVIEPFRDEDGDGSGSSSAAGES